jgi:hypothetical protein
MPSDSSEEGTKSTVPDIGLEEIKGIGGTRHDWLVEIGITTVRDLAAISAHDLHSQLRDAGHSISLNQLQDWVATAQTLIEEKTHERENVNQTPASEEAKAQTNRPEDTDANQSSRPANSVEGSTSEEVDDAEWSTVAAFELAYQRRHVDKHVETQIQVCQLREDEPKSWVAVELDALEGWIREQLPLMIIQDSGSVPSGEEPESRAERSQPVSLAIEQVRLLKNGNPLPLSFGSQVTAQWVHENQNFAVEVFLKFNDLTNTRVNLQSGVAECRFQLIAKSLTAPHDDFYFDKIVTLRRSPMELTAKACIDKISLPGGLYRLELLLSLPEYDSFPALIEIPRLQAY